jgi:hypothetical protein
VTTQCRWENFYLSGSVRRLEGISLRGASQFLLFNKYCEGAMKEGEMKGM